MEKLSNLKKPYWLGMTRSDMTVNKINNKIRSVLNTTNTVGAIFRNTVRHDKDTEPSNCVVQKSREIYT
jgi:hypothetical protein